MKDLTISEVPEKACTGCGACNNSCPVAAITMKYNDEGFLFPVIDEKLCIHCGRCYDCCPEIDYEKTETLFHEQGEVYAVMADDDIRALSTSGGMFTLVAEYVLERNGIVFGASNDTENICVKHIGIRSIDDLDKLRRSKYVQSAIGDTFSEAKEALEKGQPVFFTGCPCQIAGLHRFLGRDYDDLITADIVCHGANSTYAYLSYLHEKTDGRITDISDVNFRKKDPHGWNTNLDITFKDNTHYIETPDQTREDWGKAFLKGVMTRLCCSNCHYTKLQRVADLTLGDFWKVTQINAEWHDRKGTSLVFVNSDRGAEVFEAVRVRMKLCEKTSISHEFARKANGQLVRPTKSHPGRKAFFGKLQEEGFRKALDAALGEGSGKTKVKTEVAVKKYDIGLTGYWWSTNYGSVATYYALYKVLKEMGLSVILLDRPEKEKHVDGLDVFSRRFFTRHKVNVSESMDWDKLGELNRLSDTFLLGSDQVWGPGAIKGYKFFFFFDFVEKEKKKIAYAASFGEHFNVVEEHVTKAKNYIKLFDDISVREIQAVDICKENFGITPEWVIDPIFLVGSKEFERISKQSKKNISDIVGDKDYIFVYILNPSEEKRKIILDLSERMGMPIICVLHGKAHSFEKNNAQMQLPNTVKDVEEEDWLHFCKNSKFVITDSYHGSAISIIFNKQFINCSNKKWGQSRYVSLFNLLGIMERQSLTLEDILGRDLINKKIDYDSVNKIIDKEVLRSKFWLRAAIKGEHEATWWLFEQKMSN